MNKVVAKPEQIPYLLKLADDESPVVQEEVRRALVPLAEGLHDHLNDWEATSGQRRAVHRLLHAWRKARLLKQWPAWFGLSDKLEALEDAHRTLCDYGHAFLYSWRLSARLDEMAGGLRGLDPLEVPGKLPLRGEETDYYHPDNSFLSQVLQSGKGNPISLCTILMLLGRRLGIPYWGCNFPGHFLARLETENGLRLIDCFRGGQVYEDILSPELRGELNPSQTRSLTHIPATLEQMVSRVLRNLVGAYLRLEDRRESNTFYFLLKDLAAREKGRGSGIALREPVFHPGDLVSHKVKDYRGVIVDYELYSNASPEPEYRILVHRSPQVATARESALKLDDSGGLVAHPFVAYFFSKFEDGVYLRNSRPWEG